jgi:hypothetical protein
MHAVGAVFFIAMVAQAQTPSAASANQSWRGGLMGLPEHPAAGTTLQDADRFAQYVQMATPYFATITPGDFEANREMVRRMWAYTMALDVMAGKNPGLRPAASRARRAMNSFPIGYGMIQGPALVTPGATPRAGSSPGPAVQQKAEPKFAMTAPAVENVTAADRETSRELASRYEGTAVRAASAWHNVETLRQSLAARGMSLTAAVAASVGRLEADMDSAARSLGARDWVEASGSLDRADAEIEKISKVAGR